MQSMRQGASRLSKRFLRLGVIACATASLTFAVVAAQDKHDQPQPGWTPPAQAAAKPNPLAGNTKAAAGGRKLFLRNCAECHGEDGRGIKNAADLRLPVVQDQTDGALFWKIAAGNGGRGMPSWSRLP